MDNKNKINCSGAYGHLLLVFKELSSRIKERIKESKTTTNIERQVITLADVNNILSDFEDMVNNSLADFGIEIAISTNQTNNQQTNENKTMNKKQTIRLNEGQLKRIVAESVKRVLKEADVVGGTNSWRDTTKWADDWDEYSDYEGGKSENLMIPDFVQTWADRFEKILNDKFFQKFPNAKSTIRKDDKVFYVEAHLDNNYNYEHSLFSGHQSATRRVVLNVFGDIHMYAHKINTTIERLCNICVQLISKYATLMFGSIPGVQVMVNSNDRTKYDGSMDVYLEIEERTNYERGRYGDLGATGKPTNSRLFKNNPLRQISKKGSTYKSDDEG